MFDVFPPICHEKQFTPPLPPPSVFVPKTRYAGFFKKDVLCLIFHFQNLLGCWGDRPTQPQHSNEPMSLDLNLNPRGGKRPIGTPLGRDHRGTTTHSPETPQKSHTPVPLNHRVERMANETWNMDRTTQTHPKKIGGNAHATNNSLPMKSRTHFFEPSLAAPFQPTSPPSHEHTNLIVHSLDEEKNGQMRWLKKQPPTKFPKPKKKSHALNTP